MINKGPVDSIIFDMDGTLWDAVDSYAVIWNETLDQEGIPHQTVTRLDLLRLMGSYLDDILAKLVPDADQRERLLVRVMDNEGLRMPQLGGVLFPGVRDLIPTLAEHYRLFMVSNCGPHGLSNFVRYNKLEPYFVDLVSHGDNGRSKAENIGMLVDRYSLRSPVYVGDTQGDADNAHRAGIPYIQCRYGFGVVSDYEAAIDRFDQLPSAIQTVNSLIDTK